MGNWRYCVVGNIVRDRLDEKGVVRHGTTVFPPGRRVYLSKRLWRTPDEVTVMGLNRFKSKYVLERVPLAHIENIRCQKVFKPRVTELMQDNLEYHDMWWNNTAADYLDAQMFVAALRTVFSSDDSTDAEWLFLSDDGSTLSLYPYAGAAWEIGQQIRRQYDSFLYMNGYCWSSMIRYYLRAGNAGHLLPQMRVSPKEYVCVFHAEESAKEAVRLLAELLRRDISLLPAWVMENGFDDWDDW